jgi:integrase
MANRKVTLQLYAKTEQGWRRYPAAYSRNGRVRPQYALVDGVPMHFPEGHYELRYYKGGKTVQKNVGTDAQAAEQARDREANLLEVRHAAGVIGVKVLEEPGRVNLAKEAGRFIQAAEDRGSTVAASEYQTTMTEFLEVAGKVYADELDGEDVLRYQRALRKRGMSDRTIANRHGHLTSFLRFLKLDVKALAPITPKYERTLPEIYSVEEMEAFFASLTTDFHRVTYGIALMCGLRDQELMHLKWSDVNLKEKTLTVRSAPEWGFKVKDKEERSIPIPGELVSQMEAFRAGNPKRVLVAGTKSDSPNGKLLRTLKRLVNRAGLQCGSCEGCREQDECGQWYLHKFRSTYITRLLRAGIDVRTIMRLSGHSDLETILQYLRPADNEETQKVINGIRWKGSNPSSSCPLCGSLVAQPFGDGAGI